MALLRPATLLSAMRRDARRFGEESRVRCSRSFRPTNRVNTRNRKAIGADNVFGCQEVRRPLGDPCVNCFIAVCAKQHFVASAVPQAESDRDLFLQGPG
jgi:hypothetical protein